MASNCRVETTTKGYGDSINSVSFSESDGNSPHGEFIAGMTAGEMAKGHSMGHSDYLSRVRNMETYVGGNAGSCHGGSSGDSGLGGLKDVLGIISGLMG